MNRDKCELLLSAWECLFLWIIVYLLMNIVQQYKSSHGVNEQSKLIGHFNVVGVLLLLLWPKVNIQSNNL